MTGMFLCSAFLSPYKANRWATNFIVSQDDPGTANTSGLKDNFAHKQPNFVWPITSSSSNQFAWKQMGIEQSIFSIHTV
jgi:hypothetical protein